MSQKITPFLWFNDNAEEAMNFYCSVFKNSRIANVTRYTDAGPGPVDAVMLGVIELEGSMFYLMNGGPVYSFTPAISLVVSCADQTEVDYYWDALLTDGGKPVQCGWLTDKFGLSWQVTPTAMKDIMGGPDRAGAARAMKAMMGMIKLDIAVLQAAYDGE